MLCFSSTVVVCTADGFCISSDIIAGVAGHLPCGAVLCLFLLDAVSLPARLGQHRILLNEQLQPAAVVLRQPAGGWPYPRGPALV